MTTPDPKGLVNFERAAGALEGPPPEARDVFVPSPIWARQGPNGSPGRRPPPVVGTPVRHTLNPAQGARQGPSRGLRQGVSGPLQGPDPALGGIQCVPGGGSDNGGRVAIRGLRGGSKKRQKIDKKHPKKDPTPPYFSRTPDMGVGS